MNDAPAPQIVIGLNPDGVVAPIHKSVQIVGEIALLAAPAVDAHPFEEPLELGPPLMRMRLPPPAAPQARRQALNDWLLAQGFQELARGVRAALEEAHVFCALAAGAKLTWPLEEAIDGIRSKARRLNMPDLMRTVAAQLHAPLSFEREIESFYKIRNCLEHRGGIVGLGDLDPGREVMSLTIPELRLTYHHEGEAHEVEVGRPLPAGVSTVRIETRRVTSEYALGERIAFDQNRVAGALNGCHLFAVDLAAALPKLPPQPEGLIPLNLPLGGA